jgi:prevent-host-death family protein
MKKNAFSVSEFKSKALGLLENVSRTGEPIIVTKLGKPIAKVIAFTDAKEKPTPGRLEGMILYEEDIVAPLGAKLWRAAEPD